MKLDKLRDLVIKKLVQKYNLTVEEATAIVIYDSDVTARKMYISFLRSENSK